MTIPGRGGMWTTKQNTPHREVNSREPFSVSKKLNIGTVQCRERERGRRKAKKKFHLISPLPPAPVAHAFSAVEQQRSIDHQSPSFPLLFSPFLLPSLRPFVHWIIPRTARTCTHTHKRVYIEKPTQDHHPIHPYLLSFHPSFHHYHATSHHTAPAILGHKHTPIDTPTLLLSTRATNIRDWLCNHTLRLWQPF